MNRLFVETHQIVAGIVPINLASGANTGDVVSMKNYNRCAVVFFKGVGAASQDPTLTLLQGTDVAFATNKALDFTRVDVKQATSLAAVGTFDTITQAAANTYTEGTAGEEQAIWVVDINADDLDRDNGYDCIQASVADTGSTSQIGCLLYILYEPRYAKNPLPSAIVD